MQTDVILLYHIVQKNDTEVFHVSCLKLKLKTFSKVLC